MRLVRLERRQLLAQQYFFISWVVTARERFCEYENHHVKELSQNHHKSVLPSFTLERMLVRAPIEGVKKYSPPRGITKGDMALSLIDLFASCGNKPVMSTCSLLLSWPKTASKPTPGLTKFRSLAHWPWMKAKPLLMVLW